jgi:hypothetical protein
MAKIDGTNGNGNHGCKIYLLFVPVFSPCHIKNPDDGIRFSSFLDRTGFQSSSVNISQN